MLNPYHTYHMCHIKTQNMIDMTSMIANPIDRNFNWMENLSMQLFTLLDKSKISFYLLCNNK